MTIRGLSSEAEFASPLILDFYLPGLSENKVLLLPPPSLCYFVMTVLANNVTFEESNLIYEYRHLSTNSQTSSCVLLLLLFKVEVRPKLFDFPPNDQCFVSDIGSH